ncbi:MAG: hypothetical protein RLZZ19_237, partial [Actinomycetota bacterium]
MIAAFEGWNDAGESASGALSHLLTTWTHQKLAQLDPEDYYDFQVNRPTIKVDEKVVREIIWPNTVVFAVSTPHLENDFLIVKGIEPSMRWSKFVEEILDLADDYETSLLITMGALLADTPHSRPIPVTGSGSHPDVAERLGVEISRYEGPTGTCQDDINSFPSISESDEEHTSETLKSEDVQAIMEKNQLISCQVELRLEQFLVKTQELASFPMSKLPSQNVSFETKQPPKTNGIDVLTLQNLKNQQDYLMKLFDQVSVLQTE